MRIAGFFSSHLGKCLYEIDHWISVRGNLKGCLFFKWFYDHRSSFITIKFYFHSSCKVSLAGFKEDTHLTSLFLWSFRLWNARRGWHYCSTESAKNASTTQLQSFKILVVCCFILKQLETVWQAIKSCKGWLYSAATSAQGDG